MAFCLVVGSLPVSAVASTSTDSASSAQAQDAGAVAGAPSQAQLAESAADDAATQTTTTDSTDPGATTNDPESTADSAASATGSSTAATSGSAATAAGDSNAATTTSITDDAVDGSYLFGDAVTLVDAPELTNDDFGTLSAAPVPASLSDASRAGARVSSGGTTIDSLTLAWVVNGNSSTETNLELTPGMTSNDPQTARLRLEAQLSGQTDYEVGDIQITIPKKLFVDRNGNPTGTVTLSVPEAPDTSATFSYTEMQDCYVLTNTKRLAAASAIMSEFSVSNLIPNTLNGDGSTRITAGRGISAALSVTTADGKTVTADTSDKPLTAMINTRENVGYVSVSSTSGAYSTWPSTWPNNLTKPEDDTNNDTYVYVRWSTNVLVAGNQSYALKVDFTASGASGARVLGYTYAGRTENNTSGSGTQSVQLETNTYQSSGSRVGYVEFYAAYPKAHMAKGVNRLWGDVTYTLTPLDDRVDDTSRRSESITYRYNEDPDPGELYSFYKTGDALPYGSALNDLASGNDVTISYGVQTDAITGRNTWVDSDGDGNVQVGELGKKTITYTVEDTADNTPLTLGSDALTPGDDYRFSRLYLAPPTTWSYVYFPSGGWGVNTAGSSIYYDIGQYGYVNNGTSYIGPYEVYGYSQTKGQWVRYAYVDEWRSTNSRVLPEINAENGAVADYATHERYAAVKFPEADNVVRTRVVMQSSQMSAHLGVLPEVTILGSSDHVQSLVSKLFDTGSAQPSTTVRNSAAVTISKDENERIWGSTSSDTNTLQGSGVAVTAKASVEEVASDSSARQVNLTYTANVYEQTNFMDKDSYESALKSGAIDSDTSGTFYVLLPRGVVPNTSSVKLRSGDTVQSVELYEDYRDSGRTLMKVTASLMPVATETDREESGSPFQGDNLGRTYGDKITMTFDASYSWEYVTDYGRDLNCLFAYESGLADLGTIPGYQGEPDDPTAGRNNGSTSAITSEGLRNLMTGLNNPESKDTNSFVYSHAERTLKSNITQVTSFSKRVSVDDGATYGTGEGNNALNAYENGAYVYRISMANEPGTTASNIMFYDSVESYKFGVDDADAGDTTWQGTLQSVDVSQLEDAGVAPVVYYSTEELDVEDDDSDARDLNNGSWHLLTDGTDLSTVRAIAVDASKDEDGNSFTLGSGESLSVYLHMKAPAAVDLATKAGDGSTANDWYDTDNSEETALFGGAHAYNQGVMVATLTTERDGVQPGQVLHDGYTKVGLKQFQVSVNKSWNDSNNQDGKRPASVTMQLLANGEPVYGREVVLDASNNWSHTFTNIDRVDAQGHTINYSFAEEDVPNGYTASVRQYIRDNGYSYTVTNTHTPEEVSVSGTKTWVDNGEAGEADARPSSITVDLYQENTNTQEKTLLRSQTVSADSYGTWTYSFDSLPKYHSGGTVWNYTVKERNVPAGYVSTVTETANGYDITNSYVPYGNVTIRKAVNTQSRADGAANTLFTFRMTLIPRSGDAPTDAYEYTVVDGAGNAAGGGTITSGGTLQLKAGETATVKNLPAGVTCQVQEEDIPSGYTPQFRADSRVVPNDRQTVSMTFTNNYSASGTVYLTAEKTLTGRDLTNNQFQFQLLNSDAIATEGSVVRTAANDASGAVAFGGITYSLSDVGDEHWYIMREVAPEADGGGYTYDRTKVRVKVTVTDNGNGTLSVEPTYYYGAEGSETARGTDVAPTFANKYEASGSLSLRAWKTLTGRALEGDEFQFKVEAVGGTGADGQAIDPGNVPMPADEADGETDGMVTAKNAANGIIDFSAIKYDQTHVGNQYQYRVTEVIPDDATNPDVGDGATPYADAGDDRTTAGWTKGEYVYDVSSFIYTVEVVDNGNGTLSFNQTFDKNPVFENALAPGTLRIEKRVQGTGGAADQQFTFRVQLTGTNLPENGGYTYTLEQLGTASPDDGTEGDDASGTVASAVSDTAGDGASASTQDAVPSVAALSSVADALPSVAALSAGDDDSNVGVALTSAVGPVDSSDGEVEKSGTTGGVTWELYESGKLILKPVSGDSGTMNAITSANDMPWAAVKEQITSVYVNEGVTAGTSLAYAFSECVNLEVVDLSNLVVSASPVNMSTATSDMSGMFRGCINLTSVNLSNMQSDNLPSGTYLWISRMTEMFSGCSSLQEIDISNIKTMANDTLLSSMFNGCSSLKSVNTDGFQVYEVEGISSMFKDCSSLESISLPNLSRTTYSVSMSGVFSGCKKLKSANLDGWIVATNANTSTFFADAGLLSSVTLGNGWRFDNEHRAYLSDVPNKRPYTGVWVRADGAGGAYTSEQLMSSWNSSMAGTWVWETDTYQVNFDANANDATGQVASQSWHYEQPEALPANGFYRFGYTFAGWNTQSDGTGTSYAPGDVPEGDLATAEQEQVTLYAQWTKDTPPTTEITDGTFEIVLHAGEAAVISGLPAGVGYTVVEMSPAGWNQVSSTNETGLIPADGTATAAFVNEYLPTEVRVPITASKTLDGQPLTESLFGFTLMAKGGTVGGSEVAASAVPMPDGINETSETVSNQEGGGIVFGTITYTQAGTYRYTVREVDGGDPKIDYDTTVYDLTVAVTDENSVLSAKLSFTKQDGDGTKYNSVQFANTTKPGTLKVTKEVTGTSDTTKDFYFTLSLNGGQTVDSFILKAGGSKVFNDLPAGTTYEVSESTMNMPAGYTLNGTPDNASGTIAANDNKQVTFTNAYAASGSFSAQATKVLQGRTLTAGEFTFGLYKADENGDATGGALTTVANDASGRVQFGAVTLTSVDTYTYVIKEMVPNERDADYDADVDYDDRDAKVTVTTFDNGNGTLSTAVEYGTGDESNTFTNKLKTGKLEIFKSVVGATDKTTEQKFTFTVSLNDSSDNALAGTYTTKAEGAGIESVTEGTIEVANGVGEVTLQAGQKVTIEGLPAGAEYTVEEAAYDGYTTSVAVDGSEGAVGNSASGTIARTEVKTASTVAFTNTYAATGSWTPTVGKKLLNAYGLAQDLKGDEFEFGLYDSNNKQIATARNTAGGTVTFSPIAFSYAEDESDIGEHTYTIREIASGGDDYIYDETSVAVTVTVADNGSGTLDVTATYTPNDGSGTTYSGTDGDVFTFTNRVNHKVALPLTGRGGIALAVGCGLVLVGASAAVLLRRSRSRRSAR